jgi:3-methyladenine DNA glycosylase AlkC
MRARLEAGAESRTHVEQMALDFGVLARCVLPEEMADDPALRIGGFIQRMRAGGGLVWERYGSRLFEIAPGWASDTCRGWAAFAIPLSGRSLDEQLVLAGAFAEDPHFAVREWAWLGVRPTVSRDPLAAICELSAMAHNASERQRRFTSEVSRPRGVWSTHIPMFKDQPELAIDLLNELAPDASRYVSTSLGHWLNDAGRSRPEFVLSACAAWSAQHPLTFTRARRLALRNLLERAGTV